MWFTYKSTIKHKKDLLIIVYVIKDYVGKTYVFINITKVVTSKKFFSKPTSCNLEHSG